MTRVLPLHVLLADAQLDADNGRHDPDRYADLLNRAILMTEEARRLRVEEIAGLTAPDHRLVEWLGETLPELVETLGRLDGLR